MDSDDVIIIGTLILFICFLWSLDDHDREMADIYGMKQWSRCGDLYQKHGGEKFKQCVEFFDEN